MSTTTDDTLFVYFAGHGGWSGGHSFLQVRPLVLDPVHGCYNGRWLMDDSLAGLLDSISCAARVLLMQQCDAGGFIDDLANEHTSIICASEARHFAWPADGRTKHGGTVTENEWDPQRQTRQWHGEFSFHIMNALRGHAIDPTTNLYFNPDPGGDGVDWADAFTYVSAVDSREQPVCSISGFRTWMSVTNVPAGPKGKPVKDGGALTAICDTSLQWTIYALKGNGRNEFYSYDLTTNSWTALESLPLIGNSGKKKSVKWGGALAAVFGKVHATKGNKTHELWEYSPTSGAWNQKAGVPAGNKGVWGGAGLVAVSDSADTSVYLLKGARTCEFYHYDPRSNSWTTLNPAPLGVSGKGWDKGSCLAALRDTLRTRIFALKGSYNEFYEYCPVGDSWTTRASLPLIGSNGKKRKAKEGAGLAGNSGYVYAQKGASSVEFWAYDADADSWLYAPDIPAGADGKKVKTGGALLTANGFLWSLKGNNTLEFSRCTPNPLYFRHPTQWQPAPQGNGESPVALSDAAAEPRWNTAGDSVVFVMPAGDSILQVVKTPASGDTVIYLTSQAFDCGHPVWSPGDSVIAFEVMDANLCSQIAVVRGGTVTVLTSDTCDKRNPEWVPGTNRLVYEKDDSSSYTHIYAIDDTGGTQERLTSGDHDHLLPKPVTQNLIAFQGEDEDGFSQVMKLEYTSIAGWVESQLTASNCDHENPAVAPSAGVVTYQVFQTTGTSGNGYYQIGRMALQGSTTEYTLTSGQADHEYPTITDDGGQLHCVRRGTEGSSVGYVTSTNGYTPITDESADRDHPHVVVNALAVVSSSFEREDGIYKTVPDTTSTDNSMSKSLFPVTLTEVTPNPTGHRVRIAWQVPQATSVRLKVYDLSGQCVCTLVQGPVEPGSYVTVWPGRDNRGRLLAGGVYFLTLETTANKLRRKVILTGDR